MKKASLLTLLFLGASAPAFAAGFQISEYTMTGLGRAMAGAGVVGDDYSAIASNPAGMALVDNGMQVGTSVVFVTAKANGNLQPPGGANDSTGDIHLRQWIPHFFAQFKANEKLRIGLGVYSGFGLSTVYDSDWFANTHAIKSKLTTANIALTGAYNITDKLTIGGGAIMQKAKANLTNALPSVFGADVFNDMEADSWAPAYNIGLMYQFDETARVGFAYHSKAVQKFSGSHTVSGRTLPVIPGMTPTYLQNGKYAASAKITIPEYLLLSGYKKLGSFGLSASARWTRWSQFDSLDIYSPNFNNGVAITPENWQNTWTLSAGLDYYLNDSWTLRIGTAYDESPVKNKEYRTARIPDNDRIWASCGFSYTYRAMTIDVGYTHMFIKTSQVDNLASGTVLDAKYDMRSNIVGFQLTYDF